MRRRATRQSSNLFYMLLKQQIVELREAFNILDTNSDTVIDKEDLVNFLMSIGSPFSEEEVDKMMEDGGNSITFMLFLTMIGERLSVTDSEKVIETAFKEFDNGNGLIEENMLRRWLSEEGDKMTKDDIDLLLRDCAMDGMIDYKKLTSKIKHGEINVKQ